MFTPSEHLHIVQVKALINRKVEEMKQSPWIEPFTIPWNKLYLTGGAIASLLQGETPKDWDIYCHDNITGHALKIHLSNQKDHIKDVDEHYKGVIGTEDGKMITAHAITMSDNTSYITLIYGTPKMVKATFDYVHCMAHYDFGTDMLYISPRVYEACVKKKLIVNNKESVTDGRFAKFISRGYTC